MSPLDLGFTEEQEILKESVRDFMLQECPRQTVRQIDDSATGFSPELWQKASSLGWTGVIIPPQFGGMGGTLMDAAVLFEEMGTALFPSPLHSSCILSALILLGDGEGQRHAQLLRAIAAGQSILTLAYTEEDYGWGPENVHLEATRKNGGFVLNGVKQFVPDAGVADKIICIARTRKRASRPEEGLTLFLVDRQAPGISLKAMNGFVGEKLSEVTFNSVDVPRSSVIGAMGQGWKILAPAMEKATAVLCAYMVGAGQKVLDFTLDYTRTRVQFGQPIAAFQRVQDHCVAMVTELDGARWTTYEALTKLDNGRPDASTSVSVAKIATAEGFYDACSHSHEIHAGIGIDKELGLYLYTKKSRTFYHYLGSPAYHHKRLARLLEL
ncbi:MAG: acyl-CoA dehydrogenase [Dehalococcoidia bacterium]|nr:acyl-CoA dehydrogenase [Dehalococcoidia bacterium]